MQAADGIVSDCIVSPWQDSDVTVSGARSVVSYTPKTEMDFGSLACWASNSVGSAALPCVYLLVPIGPPDPPSRCSASNVTYSTVKVQSRNCEERGGMLGSSTSILMSENSGSKSSVNTVNIPFLLAS